MTYNSSLWLLRVIFKIHHYHANFGSQYAWLLFWNISIKSEIVRYGISTLQSKKLVILFTKEIFLFLNICILKWISYTRQAFVVMSKNLIHHFSFHTTKPCLFKSRCLIHSKVYVQMSMKLTLLDVRTAPSYGVLQVEGFHPILAGA